MKLIKNKAVLAHLRCLAAIVCTALISHYGVSSLSVALGLSGGITSLSMGLVLFHSFFVACISYSMAMRAGMLGTAAQKNVDAFSNRIQFHLLCLVLGGGMWFCLYFLLGWVGIGVTVLLLCIFHSSVILYPLRVFTFSVLSDIYFLIQSSLTLVWRVFNPKALNE